MSQENETYGPACQFMPAEPRETLICLEARIEALEEQVHWLASLKRKEPEAEERERGYRRVEYEAAEQVPAPVEPAIAKAEIYAQIERGVAERAGRFDLNDIKADLARWLVERGVDDERAARRMASRHVSAYDRAHLHRGAVVRRNR